MLEQIRHPQCTARHLVLVGRTNATAGGADGVCALRLLARPIQRHMRGENQRTRRTYPQALKHRHALPDQHIGLFEQGLERQHHTIADQALHLRMQNPRGDQRQNGLLAAYDQSVAGVVAALKTHHGLHLIGQQIDDFALALVAPLQADYDQILTHCAPSTRVRVPPPC